MAWIPAGGILGIATITLWLLAREGAPPGIGREADVIELVPAVVYALTGLTVARKRPNNSIGWLMLLIGLLSVLLLFAETYGLSADTARPRWPLAVAGFWLASWAWFPALLLPATVLLIRYPSGSPPTRRWRLLDRALIVGFVGITVALAFASDGMNDFREGLTNPISIPLLSATGFVVGVPLMLIGVPLCLTGTLWRLRHTSSPERQQLAWLVGTVVAALTFSFLIQRSEFVFLIAYSAVPISVALGVLRYRLLDIEVVLRRGLVYGTLTALIALSFVAATAITTDALSERTRTVLVAGVIAVGLIPARDLLQHSVDRFVYGDRGEPLRVVERLGRSLADVPVESLIPAVLATVSEALRVPGCAVVGVNGRLITSHGTMPPRAPVVEVPLETGGALAGRLRVAARTEHDSLGWADRRLLQTLAPQVAIVLRAVQLAEDLDLARGRAVVARSEERRRLRRDLHDGLGPSLSGVALGLEAAQTVVDEAIPAAQDLLARLRTEVRSAVDEVRRIIDDLRPLALDEAGLVEALRDHASAMSARVGSIAMSTDFPNSLPPLSPDVEAAALRIATEAITNVIRHSGARECRVTLRCDGALELSVADDGHGIDRNRSNLGVGLRSMRDRAEAVGGSLSITTGPAGTTIATRMPVPRGVAT